MNQTHGKPPGKLIIKSSKYKTSDNRPQQPEAQQSDVNTSKEEDVPLRRTPSEQRQRYEPRPPAQHPFGQTNRFFNY